MADDQAPPPAQPDAEGNRPQVQLIAQYVKDLSFENPNSPAVYQNQKPPQIDVQFNIGREKIGDDLWESVLKLEVSAQAEDGKAAFQVELVYAALFRLSGVPEEQVQPFLLVDGPAMIFPYARRILADAVRDGNFPALMLEPIDFASLYMQQQAQVAQGGGDNIDVSGQTGNA